MKSVIALFVCVVPSGALFAGDCHVVQQRVVVQEKVVVQQVVQKQVVQKIVVQEVPVIVQKQVIVQNGHSFQNQNRVRNVRGQAQGGPRLLPILGTAGGAFAGGVVGGPAGAAFGAVAGNTLGKGLSGFFRR